ncbi:MAG: PBP1A family penicillin-binding protein [Patescibacteria group bacterium]|nr:PBP1A family penicillin-binding protein [Patescibacteria group bacterium]
MRNLFKKIIFNFLLLIGLFFFLFISIVLIISSYLISELPPSEIINNPIPGGSTQIYDRSGNILIYEIGLRRYPVKYSEIPEKIILATLAAEDDSFFHHRGISLKGIIRSIILNIKTRSLNYGGSTLTQQLARNLFLSNEKSIFRKIKEIILALELERRFSKEKILEYYLNSINYGSGNIGIKAAADFYFNKNLQSLDWSEVAILVSIPKSPKNYAPIHEENLKKLKERRDFVLNRLFSLGWISKEEYQEVINKKISISQKKYTKIFAPHFALKVKQILEKMYPDLNLETAGLKVITTLNYQYQKLAEEIIKEKANQNTIKYGAKNASLLMMDAKTGEVLVMVGSKDFFDESIQGQVNMTTWPRQPGSAFKPISYVTLFQLGYPPETIIFDTPTNFGSEYKPYRPNNFDKKFRGPVNLKIALAQSINIPAVKVFYLADPKRVIENAKKFGITSIKNYGHYGLSLALGTAEISMIEMARAYSVFANDGELVSQSLILKIFNNKNELIYEYQPKKERVIDSQSIRILNNILKDYEARRGLFTNSLSLTKIEDYEIALKTGTSQFYRDAWTFGYTPNFIVGVWAGNTDGKTLKEGLSIILTLPIWNEFTKKIIKDFPKTNFLPPKYFKINKPMLNGEWFSDYGIHDILFYVDKNNPLGSMPKNPYLDSQFKNWEEGVNWWLNNSENLNYFQEYEF